MIESMIYDDNSQLHNLYDNNNQQSWFQNEAQQVSNINIGQENQFQKLKFSIKCHHDYYPHIQEIAVELGQKIIIGSQSEDLNNFGEFGRCDIVNRDLCKHHFKFMVNRYMFGWVWVKCLKGRLGADLIKQKIARFVGYRDLEIEDISDSGYQSFIEINYKKKDYKLIPQKKQKLCFYDDQSNPTDRLTIKPLKDKIDFKFIIKKRLMILGTGQDEMLNTQIYNLLEDENFADKQKAILQGYLQKLKQRLNNALLLKTNSSFIQILLLSDSDPNFHQEVDLYYKLEIQKYGTILRKLKYKNTGWWIEIGNQGLFEGVEKNRKYFLQGCQRLVTISDKGVVAFEVCKLYNSVL